MERTWKWWQWGNTNTLFFPSPCQHTCNLGKKAVLTFSSSLVCQRILSVYVHVCIDEFCSMCTLWPWKWQEVWTIDRILIGVCYQICSSLLAIKSIKYVSQCSVVLCAINIYGSYVGYLFVTGCVSPETSIKVKQMLKKNSIWVNKSKYFQHCEEESLQILSSDQTAFLSVFADTLWPSLNQR